MLTILYGNKGSGDMEEDLYYKAQENDVAETPEKREKAVFGLADSMLMAFMITFAASAMNYEQYIPEQAAALYRICLWTVCALTWAGLSFISGMRGKWQFEVFATLYLILPQAVMFLSNSGPEVFRFSLIMYSLSEFSSMILMQPVFMIGELLDIGDIMSSVIFIVISLLLFAAGMLVYKKRDIIKIKW